MSPAFSSKLPGLYARTPAMPTSATKGKPRGYGPQITDERLRLQELRLTIVESRDPLLLVRFGHEYGFKA